VTASFGLAWLAGVLSTLSPCVLPLLPIILIGATRHGPYGPLALAAGLMVTFTATGTVLASVGFALGISTDGARVAGAVMMALFGMVMLVPRLQLAVAGGLGRIREGAQDLLDRVSPEGLPGNFAVGGLLGLVWAPCTGPTLGAAIGMAAQSETAAQAAAIMSVFGLGAVTPLLALAYGSRQALGMRRERLARFSAMAKPAMGALLLIVGLAVLSGLDKWIETVLTEAMPDWWIGLTTRY
jgi:cytochrome c-type biogenesis protein